MEEPVQGKWPGLKQLDLHRTWLRNDGCAALAKAPWPLQRLDLGNNCVSEASALTHLSNGRWPDLQTLMLAGNVLSPTAMEILCQADWPHLVPLDLSQCANIRSVLDMACLCQAHWPKFSSLNLASNRNRG